MGPRSRLLPWRAGAALCLLLSAGPAGAHTAVQGIGDFYAGMLHPLTALEHVLPFVAFGLLTGQQGPRVQAAVIVFVAALLAGATGALWAPGLQHVAFVNIASAVVIGALVAAAWRLPGGLVYGIAVVFGLSHGYANGTAISGAIRPYLFIPGIGLAGLLVPLYVMMLADLALRRGPPWTHIAVRVAGSWITAIGVLVLATSWKAIMST